MIERDGLAPELVPIAERCDALIARLRRAHASDPDGLGPCAVTGVLIEALEDQRGETLPPRLSKMITALGVVLDVVLARDDLRSR